MDTTETITEKTSATRKMVWNSSEMHELIWQIEKKFEVWLPSVFMPPPQAKLLRDIGHELYFRTLLNRSNTAVEIYNIVRGGIGGTKDATPETIETALRVAFARASEPVVGDFRLKCKVLKNGTVKYRFGHDKENQKLRKRFEKNHNKHRDAAVARWNRYEPLGKLQFP